METSTTVLVLRSCAAGFIAHGGFKWPSKVGEVVRPTKWDPTPNCGDGLHGFLHGEGDGSLADWSDSAEWLVFEVADANVVNLEGKVKCGPEVHVAHVGQGATAFDRRLDAIAFLVSRGQCGAGCVGRVLTGSYRSTLTGGYCSTLTGGDYSTLTGGYRSTLTGGYGSTLTGGDHSTLTGGDYSTLTGGDGSTLTGGDGSTLLFKWWDDSRNLYRRKMFTVGEDPEVAAGVAYTMQNGILISNLTPSP